ncbi:MAG: glycine--tRNA ligase subunit beta, partial [Thiovulaceae bacterium]|nr:glycine--tRNA ligase subunit beta [Sulfurimonadaceae bacterium]
ESFVRPIRWVNVLLAEKEVEMSLFGVASRKSTYLHRMESFDAQEFSGTKDYFDKLKAGAVTLFQDERRDSILAAFKVIEAQNGLNIEIDEDLLDEVVAITEHPTPLLGSFDEAFLRLPPEVIITSMKEHQRYFPVFKEGRLINKFIVVSNALTDDFSKVIEGNERVLRPRLADGLFFYDNDLRRGLSTEGLERVVFMNGLGTLRDKIEREHDIADYLYELYGEEVCAENGRHYEMNQELLQRAVELAKADLTSEVVCEFTELQGLMGYYYANALGEEKEVALAIKEQYLPDGEESEVPSTKLGAIVAMSIKLDTLLALFSINQIPTGSRDPFALRRAVIGLIRITKEHDLSFDINAVLTALGQKYAPIDFEKLEAFFLERLNQFYKVNPSIVQAVLSTGERELRTIDRKIEAVATIAESAEFTTIFSTFKRVANITKDVDLDALASVDVSLFDNEAESALFDAFTAVNAKESADLTDRLDQLFSLKPQLDTFFDKVMVNADDEAVKNNRKALVGTIYKAIFDIADIKEITL